MSNKRRLNKVIIQTQSKNEVLWDFWVLIRKQDMSLVTSDSSKHTVVLGSLLRASPSFSKYKWIYFSCCYSFASMEKTYFFPVKLLLVTENLTLVILLNSQSKNWLVLWIKLAIPWEFSPLHFWVLLSQVHAAD